jgi:adenine phosphoribosyltransferase
MAIAIENVVIVNEDYCFVVLYNKGLKAYGQSFGIKFDVHIPYEIHTYGDNIGYPETIGQLMHEEDTSIVADNWMASMGIDRKTQITNALQKAASSLMSYQETMKEILSSYKMYENYPKPGVNFADIFAVLQDGNLLKKLIKLMAEQYKYDKITHIVGLESRGFILGMPLAYELGIGFIPVRKAGKLPGEVLGISYGTEYSQDKCEMPKDIDSKKKVLLIDDLIATGGSMKAAASLCEQNGYSIVDCCVVTEVASLRAKCQAQMGRRYTVLFQ